MKLLLAFCVCGCVCVFYVYASVSRGLERRLWANTIYKSSYIIYIEKFFLESNKRRVTWTLTVGNYFIGTRYFLCYLQPIYLTLNIK